MVSALDLRKRNNDNFSSHHYAQHTRASAAAEFFHIIFTVVTYS